MANPEIYSIKYETVAEAGEKYGKIPERMKDYMAEDYKEAFGGKPWFESYQCTGTNECGYLAEPFCPICKNDNSIKEAYPTTWLKETYFREMLTEFIPGILGLIQLGDEVPGFTTGGFTFFDVLIQNKYKRNTEVIFDSITKRFNIPASSLVFYDNETCINPVKQRSGLGPKLSQFRIDLSINLGADLVCGRTINFPWLETKERQFKNKGFNFEYFVPEGDNYSVEGNPRYFYLARMIR